MTAPVFTGTLALAISMGGIVVLAAAAGALVTWLETRASHGGEHH